MTGLVVRHVGAALCVQLTQDCRNLTLLRGSCRSDKNSPCMHGGRRLGSAGRAARGRSRDPHVARVTPSRPARGAWRGAVPGQHGAAWRLSPRCGRGHRGRGAAGTGRRGGPPWGRAAPGAGGHLWRPRTGPPGSGHLRGVSRDRSPVTRAGGRDRRRRRVLDADRHRAFGELRTRIRPQADRRRRRGAGAYEARIHGSGDRILRTDLHDFRAAASLRGGMGCPAGSTELLPQGTAGRRLHPAARPNEEGRDRAPRTALPGRTSQVPLSADGSVLTRQ